MMDDLLSVPEAELSELLPELTPPEPSAVLPVEPPPVETLPPEETPEPVEPVEVISVDELLNRLQQGSGDPSEEVEVMEEPEAVAAEEELGDIVGIEPEVNVADLVIDLIQEVTGIKDALADVKTIRKDVGTVQKTVNHPLMTTSFGDYTVTEGLLLLILLFLFVSSCVKIVKGGFSWLR